MNNFANFGQYFSSIQHTMSTLSAKLAKLESDVATISYTVSTALNSTKDDTQVQSQGCTAEQLAEFDKRIKTIEESLSALDSIFSKLPSPSQPVEIPLNGSTLDIDNALTNSATAGEEVNVVKKKLTKKK